MRKADCEIVAFLRLSPTRRRSNFKNNFRGVENVELVNLAVGSEIATKTMFEYDMSVLNSLLPNAQFAVRFDKKAREIKVDCTTLDNFCSNRGIHQIDVLKIDTEDLTSKFSKERDQCFPQSDQICLFRVQ